MKKSERTHGEYLRRFESESQGTLADFIKYFKLGRRTTLKDKYPEDAIVQIGELVHDKDTYIIRKIMVDSDEFNFKFIKREVKQEESEEAYHMFLAIRNM